MTPMNLINLNPTNKEEAKALSSNLINAVMNGEINPLELHVKLKAMQTAIEDTLKGIKDQVMVEAAKYPDKTFSAFTANIEKAETGVSYNYASCNDEKWHSFNDLVTIMTDKRKEREALLRTLKEPMNVVTEDGEIVTITPPIKSSTSSIKVTLK